MERWELAYTELATQRRRRSQRKRALVLLSGAVAFTALAGALIAAVSVLIH
ncbi:MAG TPA: hypothetical protein VM346_04215 [Sphingomicrobium sp.]|nr:hypothetical protein [Sphingomicrobium sp.]